MFWSRALLPAERLFVQQFFGAALDALLPRMRLHLRRLGDTRRALSMNGGRLYLPRGFFEQSQPQRALRLGHPVVAGIFAHELLHQWQRLQGVAVTRKALLLHVKAFCLRRDPYAYFGSNDGAGMLGIFLAASVEQQGQMWEDYVRTVVAGAAMPSMERVQAHISGGCAGSRGIVTAAQD